MFAPFSGWLFDSATVGDTGAATSPPYDVISDSERRDLIARSRHNIVRILLPGFEASAYASAGKLLREWRSSGVLIRDPSDRFYLYETDYNDSSGAPRQASGLIGALELVPFGNRVVPHEETQSKHRRDRLAVLDALEANLDPIIALSSSPGLAGLLEPTSDPRIAFEEADGSTHRLFDIVEPATIAAIKDEVASHPISIADGHHRYTTALGYRADRTAIDGEGPWSHIMAMMSPAEGSGLTIGPYHRLLPAFDLDLRRAAVAFEIVPSAAEPPDRPGDLVVVANSSAHRLTPLAGPLESLPSPWKESSTAVAAELLYPLLGVSEDGAEYVARGAEAVAAAATGGQIAVLVAPLSEHAVATAGEAGLRFPTKSTYFTPKPRAGLVLRCFD